MTIPAMIQSASVPSDSAAIQLPSTLLTLPYQCMGQSTNRVNIWQWKAALEKKGGQPRRLAR